MRCPHCNEIIHLRITRHSRGAVWANQLCFDFDAVKAIKAIKKKTANDRGLCVAYNYTSNPYKNLYIGIIKQAIIDHLERGFVLRENTDFITDACDIIGIEFSDVIKMAEFFSRKKNWKYKFELTYEKFINYLLGKQQ